MKSWTCCDTNETCPIFQTGSEIVEKFQQNIDNWMERVHTFSRRFEEMNLSSVYDRFDLINECQPIKVDIGTRENTSLWDLTRTDNPVMSKIAMTMSYLGCEIEELIQAAKGTIFPFLNMYSDRDGEGNPLPTYELELQFAQALPQMHTVVAFVSHLSTVVRNLVHQLAAIYKEEQSMYRTFQVCTLFFCVLLLLRRPVWEEIT